MYVDAMATYPYMYCLNAMVLRCVKYLVPSLSEASILLPFDHLVPGLMNRLDAPVSKTSFIRG